MKILIIANQKYFAQCLAFALSTTKAEMIICDHQNALEKFLTEEPTHIIICDYEEEIGGNSGDKRSWFAGQLTHNDIKNSLTDEVLVRLGLSSYDHEDYIKMPLDLNELLRKLR